MKPAVANVVSLGKWSPNIHGNYTNISICLLSTSSFIYCIFLCFRLSMLELLSHPTKTLFFDLSFFLDSCQWPLQLTRYNMFSQRNWRSQSLLAPSLLWPLFPVIRFYNLQRGKPDSVSQITKDIWVYIYPFTRVQC